MDINIMRETFDKLSDDQRADLDNHVQRVGAIIVEAAEEVVGLAVYMAMTAQEVINKEKATSDEEGH